jgi:uncharacterized protein YgiM (DUF1202 family)
MVLSVLACNASSAGTQAAPTATPGAQLDPSATPEPASTDTPAATATGSSVTITVDRDSLSIRRGPTTYYDVLDYFAAGETATATARNSDGSWLYISSPSSPSVLGWVSAVTDYSTTTGDIDSLPVMNPDPPMPAYIRNCTFHPMLVKPGNVLLQDQNNTSGRIAQFTPGNYAAYDQSETGPNPVFTVALTEGDSVDINADGFNNMYYCP